MAVALLNDWIIDDAGITFAYAQNVAAGHGIVSQPGRPSVEGFSNFLWMLLCVPFFWLGVFNPIWLPKLVAAVLVFATLVLVDSCMRRSTKKHWPGRLAAWSIATAPPIVIWTTSGLENSLLLLLVVAAWALTTLRPRGWALAAGALAALSAITRPEGLVYAAVVPLISAAELVLGRSRTREALLNTLAGVGAFVVLWAPLFTLRMLHFGLPYPHTYYAKLAFDSDGQRLDALLAEGGRALREKLWNLGEGIAGPLGPWLLGASLAAALVLACKGKLSRPAASALVFGGVATGAYVWLFDDWMGEYRFATPAVAFAWIAVLAVADSLSDHVSARLRHAPLTAGLVLLATLVPAYLLRFVRFAANPTMPYAAVERAAHRFNAYASSLGLQQGSILTADIGGMLLNSRLSVYDIAGLTEPMVVSTLRRGSSTWYYDHPEFYAWVFEDIRPTFVVAYRFWTQVTALEQDPRFARDYVAIDAYLDEYVRDSFQRDLHSGEFIRRDALEAPGALTAMRASFAAEPLPQPRVLRIGDWLQQLRVGPPSVVELRRDAESELRWPNQDANRAAALLLQLVQRSPHDVDARERLAYAVDQAGRAPEAHTHWQYVALRAALVQDNARLARSQRRLASPPELGQTLKRE